MGRRICSRTVERWTPNNTTKEIQPIKECKNRRELTLLSVPGKVLNRIILDRLTTLLDAELRDQQAVFRKDRSCTDHIGYTTHN